MTAGLVQMGLSNLVVSGGIALLAYAVHRRGCYPALAHLLWALALVKVVTPPLVSLPLAVLPTSAPTDRGAAVAAGAGGEAATLAGAWLLSLAPTVLLASWLLGSVVIAFVSLRRIRRFGRLLAATSSPAPSELQRLAATAAYGAGVRAAPSVIVSAAELAPLTWWAGGRVRIVLPRALVARSGADELRWVLAHELAHVRRRDHLVRWLEWAASVVGWWKPVVWWARRLLRRDEEDACDALVLEHLAGRRRSYAQALLTVTELLSRPPVGAPGLATGLGAARSLEHRFRRIVRPGRTRSAPRALVAGTVGTALLLLFAGAHAVGAPTEGAAPPRATSSERAQAVDGGEASDPAPPSDDPSYRGVSGVLPVTLGGPGPNRLSGGPGPDVIDGSAGSDVIRGGRGADSLRGRAGDDVIRGGAGDDLIFGGAGDDTIGGGPGDDRIVGGPGRDTVKAGPGDDVVRVWMDGTPDEVDCGSGRDRAIIDSTDSVQRCEVVVVRDPA